MDSQKAAESFEENLALLGAEAGPEVKPYDYNLNLGLRHLALAIHGIEREVKRIREILESGGR